MINTDISRYTYGHATPLDTKNYQAYDPYAPNIVGLTRGDGAV